MDATGMRTPIESNWLAALMVTALAGCAPSAPPADTSAGTQNDARAAPSAPRAPAPANASAESDASSSSAPGEANAATTSTASTPVPGPGRENASPPEKVVHYIARGTEPFWAVEASDLGLVLKTPEQPNGTALPAKRQPTLHGMRWAGEADGHRYSLGIIDGDCSDGMSDRRYRFKATWIYDETTLLGCAEQLD